MTTTYLLRFTFRLQACGYTVSPVSMKRVVENSAKVVDGVDRLGQGHGLIQVQAAWDLLKAMHCNASTTAGTGMLGWGTSGGVKWPHVGISVSISSERFSRGIYLRQPIEASTANTFKVELEPVFHDDVTSLQRVEYEQRLQFKSTASWVNCAEHALLAEGGKVINVHLDPRQLPVGVHVAFVKGYDMSWDEKVGPAVVIPVTVVRPEVVPDRCSVYQLKMSSGSGKESTGDLNVLSFTPGQRLRRFIVPPKGSTFVDVVIVDRRSVADSPVSLNAAPLVAPDQIEGVWTPVGPAFEPDSRGYADDTPRKSVQFARVAVTGTSSSASTTTSSDNQHLDGDVHRELGDSDVVHDKQPEPSYCGISSEEIGTKDTTARTVVLHALQVFRGTPYRDNEKRVS
jgi:hypothetical protein